VFSFKLELFSSKHIDIAPPTDNEGGGACSDSPHTDTPPMAESRRWQKFPPHTPSFLPACRFMLQSLLYEIYEENET